MWNTPRSGNVLVRCGMRSRDWISPNALLILLESIKKRVLKPYFGLGSRVKRPGIPRIGDRFFPFTGRTSTRIFMLSNNRGEDTKVSELSGS
jgi:hypothetical protein